MPLEGSSVSTCFPSITRLCWSFRIHYSFEDIWELGWPVGVKTQQGIFVIVVLLTMEDGVLRSGPWGLSSLWHSLLRKLSLLLNLACPIETRVLWEIQEALLRGGEICSPANKSAEGTLGSIFYFQQYLLFGKNVCLWGRLCTSVFRGLYISCLVVKNLSSRSIFLSFSCLFRISYDEVWLCSSVLNWAWKHLGLSWFNHSFFLIPPKWDGAENQKGKGDRTRGLR